MKSILLRWIAGMLCLPICALMGAASVQVDNLRCEGLRSPLGIDTAKPNLSWNLQSERHGVKQSAYRVLVASSESQLNKNKADLWDSGKVSSDQSIHVAYAGKPLRSKAACWWKVQVWDETGETTGWSPAVRWTMGLLNAEDWQAQWIGAPAMPTTQADPDVITIEKASYQTLDGKIAVDVTDIMRSEMAKKKSFTVHFNVLGGDPAPGVVKELVVEYVRNGKPGVARAHDFKPLPLFSESAAPGKPAPLFRREFELAAVPESASVTVHSPGYFELYINGEKVGEDVLSPAVSKLDLKSFYVTYDVSRYLRSGVNCIGLWCSEGWADAIAIRAQLDAIVAGKPVTIGTDTSWKARNSGYYRIGGWSWGDFGGERIVADELIPNWSRPGLDTASWFLVVPANAPTGPVQAQPCPLNRIGAKIPAVAIKTLKDGRYEIDFGVAMTGWLRLKMPQLEAGTLVKLTFADSRPNQARRGPTYGHFKQFSEFVSGGEAGEVFEHKFNYAAFRYVLVEGLPSAPAKEDAVALLIDSDLEEVGSFECSNELFNRIHQVNKWTQRSLNLGGYYVDCPHRERMGYGDGQVATEGFMTNFRSDGYYRKWLQDWRLLQMPNGRLLNSAPFGPGGGGPGWGGFISAVTWRHYLYYGDRRVLEENYDAIRRYVAYLEAHCKDDILRAFGGQWGFIGDWVPPRRGMDSKNWPASDAAEVFNNGYRINQMELLAQIAEVLGKTDDAAHYRKRLAEIRPKVHAAFYDAEKQEYVIDEQSYYVMPLMTGITPEPLRPSLLKKLEQNILEKNDGHLDTGMLGTYFMMEYLRKADRNDLVFTMFNQTTYPSWGHMLEQGMTTFGEQWNGFWSHVHSCFTSPDNWFYQGPAGIQADPAAPGFKNVIIKPAVVGDLTWVKAHYDSAYGTIVSNWKIDEKIFTLNVTVPPNTTATVYLPARDVASVRESNKPIQEAEGVRFLRMQDGCVVFEVGSGTYQFKTGTEEREILMPHSGDLILKKGDRIAIVGDSITEQKEYSRFIELYLLACVPELDLTTYQFGWSGEKAPGFANRMENDLVPWKPTVVTTCYGMNDGGYRPYTDQMGKTYEEGIRRIQTRCKELGARMIVGGPGAVDTETWRRHQPEADLFYNETLSTLGEIAARLASENGFAYANLHPLMMAVMQESKAALGKDYPVCGGDGVHAGPNGHLVMAYAFLKAMGLDGDIGTISVDMSGNATGTAGHRVLSATNGTVKIESTRYPFCFFGREKAPDTTRSILPFLPFNRDLNRFMLVVKNLPGSEADVTWGTATKTFSKTDLAAGINLADEFLDNPFVAPFRTLDRIVADKQYRETRTIKGIITHFRNWNIDFSEDAEVAEAIVMQRRKLMERNSQDAVRAREAVRPVTHTIQIAPK